MRSPLVGGETFCIRNEKDGDGDARGGRKTG